jgi:cell division protein FtsQ
VSHRRAAENWTARIDLASCAHWAIPAGSGGAVAGRAASPAVAGGGSAGVVENRKRIDPAVRDELRRSARARAAVAALALAGAVIAGLAAWGAWRYVTRGAALRIAEIRFHGLSRATPDELAALSPVRPGDNIVAADLGAMEKALARHPWVRSADVRRRLPRALDVAVEERRAVALVELGGLYLVDRDGEPFKRAQPGDGLDLPLVTGLDRDDYVQRRAELEPVLAGALALVESYAQTPLAGSAPASEVHVDLEHGITLYVGEEAIQVRLGSGDLPLKLERLEKALAAVAASGRRAEVVHLDNRARPGWVTVRVAGGGSEPGGVAPSGSRAGGTGPRGL